MDVPTEDQLTAEFIRRFRDDSGGGDDSALPAGDAEVVFSGMVDLPLLLLPIVAAVWDAAHRAGAEDALRNGPGGAGRRNPYGEPASLLPEEEALALLAYDEGPDE